MRNLAQAFLLLLTVTLFANEPIRTWTSADGRTLEARYLEMVGSKVRIKNASGRTFTVPLTGFSSADQEYVKKAYGRSLFAVPQPFDDDGRGGVIVASAKGRVEVLVPPRDSYSEVKPTARAVIVGESIASGAVLTTGSGATADLLLTNGTLAHLGENTKLVLSALYQKSFKGSDQKASELTKEVSPSRTALKLEEGDLVLEVRKLSKESSFLISTKMAQAGIRGTQFKVSASTDSAGLSVLEGRVDFLDAEQLATPVETAKKAGTRKGVPAKLEDMSASEQAEVKQAVEQAKGASASIDLNRLANVVDGLVAWYPFDGSAEDMSGNGNNGTVYGAILGTDRFGNANKSYSFDGVDDYIDLGDKPEFDGRDTQTISLWFFVATKGSGGSSDMRPILSKWKTWGSPVKNAFLIDAGEVSIGLRVSSDSGSTQVKTKNYFLNKWHHIALVFDRGNISVYLDGQLENEESFDSTSLSDSSERLLVGNYYKIYNPAYKTFHGSIDDIRIYNRALSNSKIKTLHQKSD
jgi:hypothetical protein